MKSSRSVKVASLVSGAVAVFVLCSIVQAAAGSTMFSNAFHPTNSVLLDLAVNLTFWPGWLIMLSLLFSAARTCLQDEPPHYIREEASGGACSRCGAPLAGAFCERCGQRGRAPALAPGIKTPEAPPVRQWFVPILLSIAIMLTLGVGSWLWVREFPSGEGTSFAEVGDDPGDWSEGGAQAGSQPETTIYTSTHTESPDGIVSGEDLHGLCAPDNARYELESRRQETLGDLDLDGRWVLQIDSKYDGVVDPLQTAVDGSHTFTLSDICVHQASTAEQWKQSARILYLRASDFGDQQNSSRADGTWVILIDPGADSIAPLGGGQVTDEDARGACAVFFPHLSGEELTNACLPRRLTAPPP